MHTFANCTYVHISGKNPYNKILHLDNNVLRNRLYNGSTTLKNIMYIVCLPYRRDVNIMYIVCLPLSTRRDVRKLYFYKIFLPCITFQNLPLRMIFFVSPNLPEYILLEFLIFEVGRWPETPGRFQSQGQTTFPWNTNCFCFLKNLFFVEK